MIYRDPAKFRAISASAEHQDFSPRKKDTYGSVIAIAAKIPRRKIINRSVQGKPVSYQSWPILAELARVLVSRDVGGVTGLARVQESILAYLRIGADRMCNAHGMREMRRNGERKG